MATFFFSSPVDVDVKLDGEDERKKVDVKLEKERIVSCPVYYDGDAVTGQARSVGEAVLIYFNEHLYAGDCTRTRWEETRA